MWVMPWTFEAVNDSRSKYDIHHILLINRANLEYREMAKRSPFLTWIYNFLNHVIHWMCCEIRQNAKKIYTPYARKMSFLIHISNSKMVNKTVKKVFIHPTCEWWRALTVSGTIGALNSVWISFAKCFETWNGPTLVFMRKYVWLKSFRLHSQDRK